jgi:hypothetical protein
MTNFPRFNQNHSYQKVINTKLLKVPNLYAYPINNIIFYFSEFQK